MVSESTEILASRRVRLGLSITGSFTLVLLAIAANDALVQSGKAESPVRTAVIALLIAAAVLLIVSLVRFVALTIRSSKDETVKRELWDELASANHRRSLVFAHLATLFVLVTLAVISMFTTLSAPWVINGLLVTAFGIQALSFALLERRGMNSDG